MGQEIRYIDGYADQKQPNTKCRPTRKIEVRNESV